MTPAHDDLELRALMSPELPPKLLRHIERVVETARGLARRHGADERRTLLAAQGHDLVRHWTDEQWLAEADRRGLATIALERADPVLLHGPIGAAILEERGWVEERPILDAIRYHTTGHPAYTPEAWAMFIADKVEPHKLARRPALQRVVDAADRSLEAGARAYLELMEDTARELGREAHPLQVETLAFLRGRI